MSHRYLCFILFLLLGSRLQAQLKKPFNFFQYDLEAGCGGATKSQTPFWLRSNQYGIVPQQNPFLTLRVNPRHDYRPDSTRRSSFDWAAGAYFVINHTLSPPQRGTTFLWPEVYAKAKWKQLELSGGRQLEVIGLGDSTLSSGFFAWSGNAMPFPKIQLQTHGFVSLGFLKHILAFQTAYAHGWFTGSYIKQSYLHQKQLYVRFGKPHWPIRLYAGLNHQVQWGGKADYLNTSPAAVNGSLPATFRDYLSLVTGRYPDDYSNNRYNSFDGANRIGNHLGSYDFALEWKDDKRDLLFYHQHPYEDASGLAFQNFPDGLTGIRLLRSSTTSSSAFRLKRLVLEYLQTTDQSGETFVTLSKYQGGDSYFNHGQYKEGWSYLGQTLGTPFIAPRPTLEENAKVDLSNIFFPNNRLLMGHLGSEWIVFKQVTLITRSSFSRNLGTFGAPFLSPHNQFSCLLSASIPIPRWAGCALKTSLALDQGQLFPSTFGGYVGLKKLW